MSAYELAHGFTKPSIHNPSLLLNDLLETQNTLDAKRNLARILCSKSPKAQTITAADLVEVYIKLPNQKHGSCSSPRPV